MLLIFGRSSLGCFEAVDVSLMDEWMLMVESFVFLLSQRSKENERKKFTHILTLLD